MEAKRIAELLKAAKERVNAPPGSRQIQLLPEEVLELLDGVEVEMEETVALGGVSQVRSSAGSKWDAIGRIAAAFITRSPPNTSAQRVSEFVMEVTGLIEV